MTVSTTLVPVTVNSWTDLGAGPFLLRAVGAPVRIIIADTLPGANDPGFALAPGHDQVAFQTSSHLWAKGVSAAGVLLAPIQNPASLTLSGSPVSVTNGLPVGGAQVTTAVATVTNGQSLSAAIDLAAASLVGIQTPAAMDSATSLTFQVSYDNSAFANFYDNSGTEYAVTVAVSRSVIVPVADFIGVRAVKVRLGTSGSPVVATADRLFILAKRP